MDDEAPVAKEVPKAKAGMGVMSVVLLCVLTVVLAVGGVAWVMIYLARSGMLAGIRGGGTVAASSAPVKKDVPVSIHPKAIEPLLINLADEGGHAYLRVGLVLEEEDSQGKKAKEEKPAPGDDAVVRDTIFDVLGRQTSTALLAPDGKERAKVQLQHALDTSSPELKVRTIYFTDFLVQR